MNSFSKVAGYKINLQKSVAFYTPPTNRLRNNKGKHSIYNSLKKPQIPRNRLNKGLSELYKENYKPLGKETEEDYRK
jgi:hypothetical protein